MPPSARPPKLSPALNPPTFDKQATYCFSLAFQCIVNIGVRGSEPIRSRVVQAGTLDVVGCILEAWLANKGFAAGPSAGTVDVQRESRGQRHQQKLEQRQGKDALQLQRALQRQLHAEHPQQRRDIRNRTREEVCYFFFALSLSFTDLNHRRRTNLWTFLPPKHRQPKSSCSPIPFSSPQILLQIAIPIYPPIIHWLPRRSSQVLQLGPSLFRVDIGAVRSSRGVWDLLSQPRLAMWVPLLLQTSPSS